MKNLYRIFDRKGRYLSNQVAADEVQAVEFARMYGQRGAHSAVFVRED